MNWALIIAGGLGLYGAGAVHGWALKTWNLQGAAKRRFAQLQADLKDVADRLGHVERNYRPISTRVPHG